LGQDLIPLTLKDRSRTLVVIDMEDEESLSAWTHEQGIAEEEIYFRHEETAEDSGQISGPFGKFDDKHRRLAKCDVMIVQELGNQRGIAHDHPSDGGLRRIDDAEGKNDHAILLQELHNLQKCSHFVVKKNGEVLHRGTRNGFQNGGI